MQTQPNTHNSHKSYSNNNNQLLKEEGILLLGAKIVESAIFQPLSEEIHVISLHCLLISCVPWRVTDKIIRELNEMKLLHLLDFNSYNNINENKNENKNENEKSENKNEKSENKNEKSENIENINNNNKNTIFLLINYYWNQSNRQTQTDIQTNIQTDIDKNYSSHLIRTYVQSLQNVRNIQTDRYTYYYYLLLIQITNYFFHFNLNNNNNNNNNKNSLLIININKQKAKLLNNININNQLLIDMIIIYHLKLNNSQNFNENLNENNELIIQKNMKFLHKKWIFNVKNVKSLNELTINGTIQLNDNSETIDLMNYLRNKNNE